MKCTLSEPIKAVKLKPARKQSTRSKEPKTKPELLELHRECQVCFKKFDSRRKKVEHIERDHSEIICGHCSQQFETHSKLMTHVTAKHRKVRCEECKRDYASNMVYLKHMRTVHANHANKSFQCDECPYKTHAATYFYDHKLLVHRQG